MLSVLIPTYNRKCYALVLSLQQQLEATDCDYEIVVAEDGSRDQVSIIANHLIGELPHCRHIIRRENVGRSAVRNYLVSEAKGEWLLFMDSDGKITTSDFVRRYLDVMTSGHDVVCGGITHPEQCPNPEQSLRWSYERDYEIRKGRISDAFRSFCFLVRKEVMLAVPFDETYRMYGWEDVQFGLDLERKGFRVKGIDNPLMNDDIETNARFLQKTEESLRTLKEHASALHEKVTLLQGVQNLKQKHLLWVVRCAFSLLRPMLRKNLLGSNPSLKCFALYRVGYYTTL